MKQKINISDKALKLIDQEQIKPIPRWKFIAKNWGLWLSFIISIGFLILGTGISWFGLADNIITPYLWLFVTVVFLVLSFLLFEKTKRAYRFSRWLVIVFISIVGLIVGGILFKAGVASRIDRNLETSLPYYRQIVPMKMMVWNNPQSGYLSGEIIGINKNYFEIKDFDGKIWTITGKPLVRGRVQIIVGEEVKLIGTQTNNKTFKVDEVRPWTGTNQNMLKENN
ncbi:MAG: hypothetical protein WC784_02690 [Candidatus Shapirobacteria bacterium]|jgi:hypothetical protein